MPIDLLLIEELLASATLWRQAPDSLRSEAIAMVSAITQDLVAISGLQIAILLSPESSANPALQTRLPPDCRRCTTSREPAEWLRQPDLPPDSIHNLLIVAPEFNGILVDRLRAAEHGPLRSVRRMNLPAALAAVFSDKFATARWLTEHQLPTPQTWLITDEDQHHLTAAIDRISGRRDCHGVLKPRFGAGCDQVTLIPTLPEASTSVSAPDDAGWVLQERMPGRACSISLIGQGLHRPALILPPGRQQIRRDDYGCLHYHGGQIPCHPDFVPVITAVAQRFRTALGPFLGWMGLDLVVNASPTRPPIATIIEVNPRLCTSCIGYRQLTPENLIRQMLFPETSAPPIPWVSKTIRFSVLPD
ncbi:MAG: ATP-grasp domain-containing protein [Planctomycetota bacterium]